ncbi:MAG: 3-methyl-2-oxobutanoate dehydrogenase subunit VorB [Gudongella sp.]|jgi:2-oxoglutarate ferredoxin oxidoreductase subunit alpha|nr:3-methyl-2-oxobutanoate dehydrogenase subunit VorB [Gudongella sp.]
MTKVLMKGNEAVGAAAIAAGCKYFFGYPITPQSEVPEYFARELPKIGGVFVQAESEVAAINMVYGASGAGARVMTSSSSPGIALKQEGISYLAGAELPAVIVDMMRGGPGLGSIQAAQGDYFLATRGGGNGDYRLIVLAPANVQELVDLIIDGFDLADIYRTPVMILGDGMIGQMMEPVEFTERTPREIPPKDWATVGTGGKRKPNIINSVYLAAEDLEAHNHVLQAKYAKIRENEKRVETYNIEDADIVVTAYGTTSRIVRTAIAKMEKEGMKVGFIRPISLYPFPNEAYESINPSCKAVLTVEMSAHGQMIDDVRLSLNGSMPTYFYGRSGGMVPSPDEIINEVKQILGGEK